MSNTSTITPYSSSDSRIDSATGTGIAAACLAGAMAAASVTKWLLSETEGDQVAFNNLKKQQRKERLRASRSNLGTITTVSLNLRHVEPLIRAAQNIGYKVIHQDARSLKDQSHLLLQGTSGRRLAIGRDRGRLIIQTAGEVESIESLVQRHTLDRVVEHLAERCTDVKTATLTSGEVQILARERDRSGPGGTAEIKAQVRPNGRLVVDVDRVKGNLCMKIVSDLAEAIGGKVEYVHKKNAYFQLPGEPAMTRIGV